MLYLYFKRVFFFFFLNLFLGMLKIPYYFFECRSHCVHMNLLVYTRTIKYHEKVEFTLYRTLFDYSTISAIFFGFFFVVVIVIRIVSYLVLLCNNSTDILRVKIGECPRGIQFHNVFWDFYQVWYSFNIKSSLRRVPI